MRNFLHFQYSYSNFNGCEVLVPLEHKQNAQCLQKKKTIPQPYM